MGVKLPVPLAPFQELDIQGGSITIDGKWDNIVLPTGHPRLLPNFNEYTLSTDHTLPTAGVHMFVNDTNDQNGLKNIMTKWISIYDSTQNNVTFFLFTDSITRLALTITDIHDIKSLVDKNTNYMFDSNGRRVYSFQINTKITSIVLYPRNGQIYYGNNIYPNFITQSFFEKIPNIFDARVEGSVTKFLVPFTEKNTGQAQLFDSSYIEILDKNYIFMFSNKSNTTATIIVHENEIITNIPDNFAGINIETLYIKDFITTVNNHPSIIQLFKNIGPSVLGCAGTTCDQILWVPDGENSQWEFSRATFDSFFSIISDIGWKVIWFVNLAANDAVKYTDEANYIKLIAGGSLAGIAIGQEPEAYIRNGFRDSDYTISDYLSEWEQYANGLISNGFVIHGPNTSHLDMWFTPFVQSESTKINYSTSHYFASGRISGDETYLTKAVELLSVKKQMNEISSIKSFLSASGGLPLIIYAMSVGNGGQPYVSDSFVSTLWALNYFFTCLELGVHGVYMHGVIHDDPYTIIDSSGAPRPMYYSFLAFHNAAPNGNCVKTDTHTPSKNITSYSVLGDDNKLRVTIINKDLYTDADVVITTQFEYSHASAMFLSAPNLTSLDKVTFGGAEISEDGTWAPIENILLLITSRTVSLNVPYASAVIITFD